MKITNQNTKKTIEPTNIKIKTKDEKGRIKINLGNNKDKIDFEIDRVKINMVLGELIQKRYIKTKDIKNTITLHPQKIELKDWNEMMNIKLGEKTGDNIQVILHPETYKIIKTILIKKYGIIVILSLKPKSHNVPVVNRRL